MKVSMRKFASTLLPPMLSLGLLSGIVAEQRSHLKPRDVEKLIAWLEEAAQAG